MRRSPLVAILGSLALIATTFATPAKISAQAKTTSPAKTAAAKPHEEWAAGKIERFDSNANTVVVKQGTHEMTFVLAPDAHVMIGKKGGASRRPRERRRQGGQDPVHHAIGQEGCGPRRNSGDGPEK